MRNSFRVLTFIIGCLLAISLFTIGHNLLQANEEWEDWETFQGEDDLSNFYGSFWVGDLGYDAGTGWTTSSHWFQVQNNLGFDLNHSYQFKQGVYKIITWDDNGNPDDVELVGDDGFGEVENRNSKDGEVYWHPGSRGVDCSGEEQGNYQIIATTVVRANIQGGNLDVSTSAKSFFDIRDE